MGRVGVTHPASLVVEEGSHQMEDAVGDHPSGPSREGAADEEAAPVAMAVYLTNAMVEVLVLVLPVAMAADLNAHSFLPVAMMPDLNAHCYLPVAMVPDLDAHCCLPVAMVPDSNAH